MRADCHMHMVLDGIDWKQAIARHQGVPDDTFIHQTLRTYQQEGYTYLRDGGDRWGVSARARELATEYGIRYRTPLSPLSKKGHYGGFIGEQFETLKEYTALVKKQKANGADFIKIMISGLMDFSQAGVLTEEGLEEATIAQMVSIAHQEGMAVMAHCNGSANALAAANAGVDSIEHGAYLNRETLAAMAEQGVVWVPTVSTVYHLLGKGRYPDDQIEKIWESACQSISAFCRFGGLLAPGTDAGAWAVFHGSDEEALLLKAGATEESIQAGTQRIQAVF